MDIYLTNTLTGKKEKFIPINPPYVGMYSCGPTVYSNAHIGHMRRYVGDDVLKKALRSNGFVVKHVMNITDVGHLTSDADTGEDKVEKAAKESRKSAWDIAKFYTDQFFASTDALNIDRPDIVCRATEHIREQIELVRRLEEKGFTYRLKDGVYFDTSKFPDYGKLAGGKAGIMPGARVDIGEKKNPTDFALWKFTPEGIRRQMQWESPWGVGFPGWHIECSAMSMKYLGESFDIHTGGVDHIPIHHTNEIAQSEAATGKPFVKYWIHFEFLTVEGRKMSKSLGNIYTVEDIKSKGFDPLALRYLFLTAHYKDKQNFTWEALQAAQNALNNLRDLVLAAKVQSTRTVLSTEKSKKVEEYLLRFTKEINDDLNTPKALAIVWEALKSNIPSKDKYDLVVSFDEVLGLGLGKLSEGAVELKITEEVRSLVDERERLRKAGDFEKADKIRNEIEKRGFKIEDTPKGPRIRYLNLKGKFLN